MVEIEDGSDSGAGENNEQEEEQPEVTGWDRFLQDPVPEIEEASLSETTSDDDR